MPWVTSPIAMGNQPHSYAQKQVIALGNQPHFSWVNSPIATFIAWLCFMLGKRPWLELVARLILSLPYIRPCAVKNIHYSL